MKKKREEKGSHLEAAATKLLLLLLLASLSGEFIWKCLYLNAFFFSPSAVYKFATLGVVSLLLRFPTCPLAFLCVARQNC